MAANKKTFIFYSDWINMVREMPSKDAGDLLKHILSYVNDENPTTENILVKMAFGHMKPMIKSDLVKWEGIREKRSEYGKKGGQAKAKQKLSKDKQLEAVNDNVNVNVNVNDNVNEKGNNKPLLSQVDESTLDQREKEYYQIALSFWQLIKSNLTELNLSIDGINKAEFKTWIDPIRLLIETDKKNIEEIREVFSFVRDDDFWREQIQSTSKLRKKDKEGIKYFDKLLIKSRNGQRKKSSAESDKSGVSDDYKNSILERLLNTSSPEEVQEGK